MLIFPIKEPWFSKIKSGEKLEEYRDMTDYWRKRLETIFFCPVDQAIAERRTVWVKFRNGYRKDSPVFEAKVRLLIGLGMPEWGAKPNKDYFVLSILETYDPETGAARFNDLKSGNAPPAKPWTDAHQKITSARKYLAQESQNDIAEIAMFIGRFMTDGQNIRNEVIEAFTQGCCYWFAYILAARFKDYDPEIMHDPVAAHFGCYIRGHVYDITGDVTTGHQWEPWDACDDENLKRQITEQCIMF